MQVRISESCTFHPFKFLSRQANTALQTGRIF
jgi:hypothetical protein